MYSFYYVLIEGWMGKYLALAHNIKTKGSEV